jgi:hypothetical protein
LPRDPEIVVKAKHYAGQIRQKRLARAQESVESKETAAKEETQYERVDINSLITNDTKKLLDLFPLNLCYFSPSEIVTENI